MGPDHGLVAAMKIEIRTRDVAQCVCLALREAADEPVTLANPDRPFGRFFWKVTVWPGEDKIDIRAHGDGEVIGDFSVPYPTGSALFMLDESYCARVAAAAEEAFATVAKARAS